MTKRRQFIAYVRQGGERFASPQIGCGSGYDTKISGQDWFSDTTLADTIAVTQRYDMVPLYNIGLPEAGLCDPELGFSPIVHEEEGDRRRTVYELKTPFGSLYREFVEHKARGVTPVRFAVETKEDLRGLESYIDGFTACDLAPLTAWCAQQNALIGDKGALSFQWSMQPYELLSWPSTVDTMLLAHDYPELVYKLMDKICALNLRLMDAVRAAGADFVFLGGPAAEMISPQYFERFLVPYSKMMTDEAHRRGLLVYSHVCSPIEPMLTMGYYNQFGIDCFETLSMPPVGNVRSLADALTKLDETICVRGNIGLDALLNCTAEQVEELCFTVLREAEGRKFILAASDYLFYETPEENVVALRGSVKKYANR